MNIKDQHYAQVNRDFQLLSETIMHQFTLVEKLTTLKWDLPSYEKTLVNEDSINKLKTKIMDKLPELVILFTPLATELRRIVSYHEAILYLEKIGNFLVNIVELTKTIDLSASDYKDFKATLNRMFVCSKEMVNVTTLSFFYENGAAAHQLIENDQPIDALERELSEHIALSFQEIPLNGQDLVNITGLNTIAYIIKLIKNDAVDMARSTIFIVEGSNTTI
jgi:phosphate transport system protein